MLILLRQKRDKTEQWHQFTMELKNCIFFYSFFPSIPWLSRDIPGQEGTTCQNLVLARPMAKCQNPSRSIPWQDFELVPLSLCTKTMKSFLSLCPAGQENSSRWKPQFKCNFKKVLANQWVYQCSLYMVEYTMRKNLPKTLDQLIFCKYTLVFSKCSQIY